MSHFLNPNHPRKIGCVLRVLKTPISGGLFKAKLSGKNYILPFCRTLQSASFFLVFNKWQYSLQTTLGCWGSSRRARSLWSSDRHILCQIWFSPACWDCMVQFGLLSAIPSLTLVVFDQPDSAPLNHSMSNMQIALKLSHEALARTPKPS